MKLKQYPLKGYIAIMTVLSLLVFSLSLLVAVPYLSIGGAQQALALSEGEALLSALEGCAEDTLLLSVRSEDYIGGSYAYLGMLCDVTVEKVDTTWTLSISGSRNGLTRTLQVVIDRAIGVPGVITLTSWLEQ